MQKVISTFRILINWVIRTFIKTCLDKQKRSRKYKNNQLKYGLIRDDKSYNYTDKFSDIIHTAKFINAAELSELFFSSPRWITVLMTIRNIIMKPFGLKKGRCLSDLVHIEPENLETVSKNDKHLDLEIAFV